MYITKEKFEELKKKYSNLLIMGSDVRDALNFVQDFLEAEAEAIKECEPDATASINRLNMAAYEVSDLCGEIENENFWEKEK